MWHVLGREELCKGFSWGNLRKKAHLNDLGTNGRIILKWTFMLRRMGEGLGLIYAWLKRGTAGVLFQTLQ
jgi:hypothetical protein